MSSRMSRDLIMFGSRKAHLCSLFSFHGCGAVIHMALTPRTAAAGDGHYAGDAATDAGSSWRRWSDPTTRAGGGGRRRIHEKDFRRGGQVLGAAKSGRRGSSTSRSRRGRRMQTWLRQWRWPRLNRRISPLLISRSSKTRSGTAWRTSPVNFTTSCAC